MTDPLNMPGILCQQALARVLVYLDDVGVELTADNCRRALGLIETVLAEGDNQDIEADLPARCFERIPDYFECPHEAIPQAGPPLKRGCIGYE